jgi:hypothetical protein
MGPPTRAGAVSGPSTERPTLPIDPRRLRLAEAFYTAGRNGVPCDHPVDPASGLDRSLADAAHAAGVRDAEVFGPLSGNVGRTATPCG